MTSLRKVATGLPLYKQTDLDSEIRCDGRTWKWLRLDDENAVQEQFY